MGEWLSKSVDGNGLLRGGVSVCCAGGTCLSLVTGTKTRGCVKMCGDVRSWVKICEIGEDGGRCVKMCEIGEDVGRCVKMCKIGEGMGRSVKMC